MSKLILNNKTINTIFKYGFLFILLFSLAYYSLYLKKDNKFLLSNETINKIEQFKKQNNRLPETLNEIGIKETEEGPIYYHKENFEDYIVWYANGIDQTVTYDSITQKWQ